MTVDAVVFDVNETLFPLDPIRTRMVSAGLDAERFDTWFRAVLVDGIAASAAGSFAAFTDLARHHLEVELERVGLPVDDAPATVLAGFAEVEAHPDVEPALQRLRGAGVGLATLTNGTAEVTEGFLERAGIGHLVDHVWDVGSVGRWKPHAAPYRWAVDRLGVGPERVAMVAAHPWDLHGASAAGLVTGWVDRQGSGHYPPSLTPPDHVGASLVDLADALLA